MKTIDDIKFTIQHIRGPIAKGSENWNDNSDQWLATFKTDNGFFTVDYYTGIGHRKLVSFGLREYLSPKQITQARMDPSILSLDLLTQLTRPATPTIKDVLYSIYSDAMGADENFKDWCDNYDYSDDSIQALNIYKACIEQKVKLRKLGLSREYLESLADF